MNRAKVKARYLAILALFLFPLLLNATHILKNDLLKIQAAQLINDMGDELESKTKIHAYVIATNEHFPEKFNLVEYSKKYDENMSKPYVLYIFAPFATIIKASKERGRVGIIPSSDDVRAMYDYEKVRDAGIDVIAVKDSNKIEDKFNVGVVQAYSELADNIAASQGIQLEKTIPNDLGPIVTILRIIIYIGSALVLWIFVLRPLLYRRKNEK